MKAISTLVLNRNILSKNLNISKYIFSNTFWNKKSIFYTNSFSLIKTTKMLFSGSNKESSSCHGGDKQEDELEKKLKSINLRIIQCINLGQFDDALELSDEYISQIKTNFGKIFNPKLLKF